MFEQDNMACVITSNQLLTEEGMHKAGYGYDLV